ncbi:hypothetical protein N9W34_01590 [Rickettsiales bacterium]|nr:hypothetical protein [Rickettsiales bacterium]
MSKITLQKSKKQELKPSLPKEICITASESHILNTDTKGAKAKQIYILNGDSHHIKGGSKSSFVKNTHSNEWTALEILAAKFASLTGITVPETLFGEYFERSNETLKKATLNRKDKEKTSHPFFVNSKRLKGYRDISTLIDYIDQAKEIIFEESEKKAEFVEKYKAHKKFVNSDNKNMNPAERKMINRDNLTELFLMLPTEFTDQFDRLHAISIWLGNWDLLNFDLENCGVTIMHFNNHIEIEAAMVDFGNCLFAGFGGKHKSDSFQSANREAKIPATHPNSFDPRILAMPDISISYYDDETESLIEDDFEETSKNNKGDIPKEVAKFSKECEMIGSGTMPRRLPFEKLIEKNSQQMDIMESGDASFSKGFMYGIYSIACISDEAIEGTTKKWFKLSKDGPVNFCYDREYTAEDIIDIMKSRRDHLQDLFSAYIDKYKQENPEDAKHIEQQANMDKFTAKGILRFESCGKIRSA